MAARFFASHRMTSGWPLTGAIEASMMDSLEVSICHPETFAICHPESRRDGTKGLRSGLWANSVTGLKCFDAIGFITAPRRKPEQAITIAHRRYRVKLTKDRTRSDRRGEMEIRRQMGIGDPPPMERDTGRALEQS
jgi:hypothetical protein